MFIGVDELYLDERSKTYEKRALGLNVNEICEFSNRYHVETERTVLWVVMKNGRHHILSEPFNYILGAVNRHCEVKNE